MCVNFLNTFKLSKSKSVLSLLVFGGLSVFASDVRPTFISNLESGKEQTIITYGTSLTKIGAWPSQLESVLKQQDYSDNVNFINSAQGGSNSEWGKSNLDEKVIMYNPDTVFIEFAMNDSVYNRNITISDSRVNLEEMIDRLWAYNSKCEVILMTMNPAVEHHGLIRPDLESYYEMYRDVAKERGLSIIDNYVNWKGILDENPALFLEYVPDGIHPVRKGSLKVIIPAIQKFLGLNDGNPDLDSKTPCWGHLFRSMDIDKDDEVTFEEYLSYWEQKYIKIDKNKDGSLQSNEYSHLGIFNYLDSDNDNSVILEEYLKFYTNYFTKGDKDVNNSIVDAELIHM